VVYCTGPFGFGPAKARRKEPEGYNFRHTIRAFKSEQKKGDNASKYSPQDYTAPLRAGTEIARGGKKGGAEGQSGICDGSLTILDAKGVDGNGLIPVLGKNTLGGGQLVTAAGQKCQVRRRTPVADRKKHTPTKNLQVEK